MIDFTTDFGQRVLRRLQEDWIIWLTTVGKDGTPQPRPVWFLWDGETFLIFSRPEGHKVSHIRRFPKVSLNLDGDGKGGDIVVLTGEAWIEDIMPTPEQLAAYMEKYKEGLKRINMSPADFETSYQTVIRVKPTGLRGH